MKIYAPVNDFNGYRGGVKFINGVGETDNPRMIEWFKVHGYKVPLDEIQPVEHETTVPEVEAEEVEMMGYSERERNLEELTPLELRELAKSMDKGHLIKNTRDKEKLIKIIRG